MEVYGATVNEDKNVQSILKLYYMCTLINQQGQSVKGTPIHAKSNFVSHN